MGGSTYPATVRLPGPIEPLKGIKRKLSKKPTKPFNIID